MAERHEIAARYSEWEIIGPAEIRNIDPSARYFTPWKIVPHADLMRIEEPPPELQPHLRSRQRLTNKAFLARLFLRRYGTYCARARRYSQMQDAANLHGELAQTLARR